MMRLRAMELPIAIAHTVTSIESRRRLDPVEAESGEVDHHPVLAARTATLVVDRALTVFMVSECRLRCARLIRYRHVQEDVLSDCLRVILYCTHIIAAHDHVGLTEMTLDMRRRLGVYLHAVVDAVVHHPLGGERLYIDARPVGVTIEGVLDGSDWMRVQRSVGHVLVDVHDVREGRVERIAGRRQRWSFDF